VATFEKRVGRSGKTTWRVRGRRHGGPWLTKSFGKKGLAEEWARSIEHKLDAGKHVPSSEARKRTVADVIDRYLTITFPPIPATMPATALQTMEYPVTNRSLLPLILSLIAFPFAANAGSICKQASLEGPRVLSRYDIPPGGTEGNAEYEVDTDATVDLGFGTELPDVISFQFYTQHSPALVAGTFDLGSALNSNFATCESMHCCNGRYFEH
jgi:hypothetical protein